jgi:hypothetical protein
MCWGAAYISSSFFLSSEVVNWRNLIEFAAPGDFFFPSSELVEEPIQVWRD